MLQTKTITICKHEGYLTHAKPIISYFITVCVYDMISSQQHFSSRSYMLRYSERVCDRHNHNACTININYKINYSRISIMGIKMWNQIQSELWDILSV